jgi:glycosyltransferase involved in cell wall biosynthesis
MKIILVSSLFGLSGGGAGLVSEQLAKGLSSRGWEVSVITTSAVRNIATRLENGYRIHSFKPLNLYSLQEKDSHSSWQKVVWQLIDVYNPHVARVLGQIFEVEKPDLIHVHKMRGFSGAVWPVSVTHGHGNVLQTCHDYESISPMGTLRGVVGNWAETSAFPLKPYQMVRQVLSRNIRSVTAPSKITLQTITSKVFRDAQKHVIPNTHGWSREELDKFKKYSPESIEREVVFLFLGRLEPEKGVRELCQAFTQTAKHYPNMQLAIAGWGSLEESLKADFSQVGNIRFFGKVSGSLKEAIFQQASVLVMPSLVKEAFGIGVVEAYAFGKPVIASRIGGLPEIVTEGETGWLVPAGDTQALAERMKAIVEKPSPLLSMSMACYQQARLYTREAILDQYEQLYSSILE